MSHTTSSLARHAEQIARALLGTPSKAHSTAAQLRYGSHGSLALEIAGDKIGTWYDHEQEVGGGLLDLIERKRKCNRAAAIEWLKSIGVDTQRGNGAAGGQQQRREAIYIYHSRAGTPLYCVVRWSPVKTFSQHPYDLSTGTFATGKGAMKGVELVPYRLPELLADPAARIWTAEGEKAVDRLAGLGLVATCNPGGAGKWPASFARWFTGRDIAILPDADAAGKAHAQDVAAKLQGSAASVRILELPDLPAKGDISDWLDRGGTVEQLQTLVESASLYPPYNRATAQHLPALATEPSILAVFRRDVALRGLVGECAVAQLLYLAITSRLLDRPVSVAVKGHSASGKSHTVDHVLAFFPPEAVIKFTGMSERALVYRDDDYSHRTLVIYELTGLRETNEDDMTSYFVRSLLSEGRLEYDVTVRGEDGRYETQRIVKEGPTNLVFTTTKTRVHAENETRVLSLHTDDGTDQTRAVLAALVREAEDAVDLDGWRDLQSWLQTSEKRVTIPYGAELAAAVPPLAVRLRRDFGAVLALIRAHAVLHQQTRQRDAAGRIVAAPDDYLVVRELVSDVLSEGVGATVSDVVRETVAAVKALGSPGGVTVSEIARHLRVDKSNASRRVHRAADGGYLKNEEDKRGRPGRWVIGEPLPEAVELLPAQLATACNAEGRGNLGSCADAPVQEGIEREDEDERITQPENLRAGDAAPGGAVARAGDAGVACCHCRAPIQPTDRVIERDDGELIHQSCFRKALSTPTTRTPR